MKNTDKQKKFWLSSFGKAYLKRNPQSPTELDKLYRKNFGIARTQMNKEFLRALPNNIKILEVGASFGNQLLALRKIGFQNLYGVEINPYVVEYSRKNTKHLNIIQGDALDLPFKDGNFELVFTSGLLIHINPKNLKRVMREIYRCSKKYIWGCEYFEEKCTPVLYHRNKNVLWKTDFAKTYLSLFPNLKLIKEKRFKYLSDSNVDSMFLLKKQK